VPSQSANWASTEVTSPRCPRADDRVIEQLAIVASHAPSSCTFTALCRPSLGLAYPEDYRYFQEFYDNRTRTLHPGSRLGDFPYAPLAADDYNHLRSVLPGIFGYLVTGKHTPEFEMLFRRKAEEGLRREAASSREAKKKSTSLD
jgi:hypothetical protein